MLDFEFSLARYGLKGYLNFGVTLKNIPCGFDKHRIAKKIF